MIRGGQTIIRSEKPVLTMDKILGWVFLICFICVPLSGVQAQSNVERVFWDAVKGCTAAEEVKAYLESFPEGKFASEAKTCLARIAPDPETVENTINLTHEDRKLIQYALNARRLNAGTADGVFGRGTRAAIKRYQKNSNAEETGFLPEIMAKSLIAEGRKIDKTLVAGHSFRDCSSCPEMVVLPSGLIVGKYEVTQKEWRTVMSTSPSNFRGNRNPVENVNWDDANAFVRKLSAKTGIKYHLLSDKQWEYAARAGTTTEYYCGDRTCFWGNAWYDLNSKGRAHPVGEYRPNAFGLYDMFGNVAEWVEDCGLAKNGWEKECSNRSVRGGGWTNSPYALRSSARITRNKYLKLHNIGFRVARRRREL